MKRCLLATSIASLFGLGAAAAQESFPHELELGRSSAMLAYAGGSDLEAGLALPLFDEPGDGALWVRGANFKARFDQRGFEFIPFLGSDAPKDYPLDFSIESARVGERELSWSSDAEPERDGSLVIFHRGALDETFDVGRDSIEHGFVLDRPVAGGDLVIRIRVDSELQRAQSALGTDFANERGGVHYGRATIFDSHGEKLVSATRLHDDAIEITLPQIELERAVFPLTVDPVITTFTVNGTLNKPSFPDTSFDLTTNTWLCVYELTFSSADHDILASQLNGSGSLITSVYVDVTGSDWTKPRVANCHAQNQFMVVAQVNLPASKIGARSVRATDVSMSAQFDVSPFPGQTYLSPDIGGDDYPLGTPAYCVAYLTVGQGVWCSRVLPTGTVFPVVPVMSGSSPVAPVRISKSNGHWSYGDQRWTVGWQESNNFPEHPGTYIKIRQIDLAGNALGSWGTQIGNDSPYFSISPLLDEYGPERRFYCAQSFTCPTCDGQLYVLLETRNGSVVSDVVDVNPDGVTKKLDCSVETDGSRFYVVYAESPGPDSNVYMASGFPSGQGFAVTQSHVPVATGPLNEGTPSVASKHSSGSVSPDALCVWKRFAGTFTKKGITFTYPDAILGAIFN